MRCFDNNNIYDLMVGSLPGFVPSKNPGFKSYITFNVVKEYPKMFKVLLFKSPKVLVKSEYSPSRRKKVDSSFLPSYSSLRRTRSLISDIVACNDFEFFCTFTFDPDKVDRYNYFSCLHKISHWLHRQKINNSDFKYLVVPELHKDGAIHFHALISHYSGSLRNSHHFTPNGQPIYNITSYRSGFSTAIPVTNVSVATSYILKYVTKGLVSHFNKRRFISSHNLVRPIKSVNSSIFFDTLPLFREKVADFSDSELYFIYK